MQRTSEWELTADPADRQWVRDLRSALIARHNVPRATIDGVVGEVHQAVIDTGEPTAELFGPAADYAEEVARTRLPLELRAERDLDGQTPTGVLGSFLVATGGILLGFGLTRGGEHIDVDGPMLTFGVAAVVVWTLAQAAGAAVHEGRARRSWTLLVACLLLAAGGIVAMTLWPRTEPALVTVEAWPVAAAGLVLLVASRWAPRHRPNPGGAEIAAEEWYARLGSILTGRYQLPRTQAVERVREARSWAAEAGVEHPAVEMGEVQAHARRVMDALPDDRTPRARSRRWIWLIMIVAFGAYAVISASAYGIVNGRTVAATFVMLGLLWLFLQDHRVARSTRTTSPSPSPRMPNKL